MITYTIHDWNQHGEEVAYDVTAHAPTGEAVKLTGIAFDVSTTTRCRSAPGSVA